MPPETNPDGSPAADDAALEAAIAAADAQIDDQLAQTPEAIRSSPEFRAVEARLRSSARENGRLRVAEARSREAAETNRQAAEAERQTALEAQLTTILGADGIAAYQEVADLGATDPVAAARRFAELMASGAQNAGQPAPDPTAPPNAPGGVTVPAQTPPPPSGGVDGNASLQPPNGEDLAQLTSRLDERYAAVVKRNNDPTERNRVTMRDRADGFISYIGSAYAKALGRG